MGNRNLKNETPPSDKAKQMLNPATPAASKNSLEKVLLAEAPFREALEQFEALSWRDQQLIMTRVRIREQAVSLKLLPLAMGIFTIFIGGVVTWVIRTPNLPEIGLLGLTLGAAGVLAAIRFAMGYFQKQDAHFNSWADALKESHGLRTKAEEEAWKSAPHTTTIIPKPDSSSSGSESNCQKVAKPTARPLATEAAKPDLVAEPGTVKIAQAQSRRSRRTRS
ncbi:UNVERIFIED_ORG: hypothetical protein J2X79_003759 [Arthrobacter globiformis]|nr:hypothetical protein [Arthrobacter globiformis]